MLTPELKKWLKWLKISTILSVGTVAIWSTTGELRYAIAGSFLMSLVVWLMTMNTVVMQCSFGFFLIILAQGVTAKVVGNVSSSHPMAELADFLIYSDSPIWFFVYTNLAIALFVGLFVHDEHDAKNSESTSGQ